MAFDESGRPDAGMVAAAASALVEDMGRGEGLDAALDALVARRAAMPDPIQVPREEVRTLVLDELRGALERLGRKSSGQVDRDFQRLPAARRESVVDAIVVRLLGPDEDMAGRPAA